jgi:diguanylate cyclase (GGDEF)-like protein/PAS domain S-box-containing protein
MFRRLMALFLFRGTRRTSPVVWVAVFVVLCGYGFTAFVVNSSERSVREAQEQNVDYMLDHFVDLVQQRLTFFDDLLKENADQLDGSMPSNAALGKLCAEYARQSILRGVAYIGFVPNTHAATQETPDTVLCSFDGQRLRQERLDWHVLADSWEGRKADEITLLWGVSNRQLAEKLGISDAVLMASPVLHNHDSSRIIGWIVLLAKSSVFGGKLLETDDTKYVRFKVWPAGARAPLGESMRQTPIAANVAQIWRFEATNIKGFWDVQLGRSLSLIGWGGIVLSTALGLILFLLGASIHSLEDFLITLRSRLSDSEEFAHDVVANLAEGVYTTDLSGRITFVNPEACRMLGYTQSELLSSNDHELFHSNDPKAATSHKGRCRFLASILRGESFETDDERFRAKDGHTFPVAVVASPIVRAFRTIGMVVSFRDVTHEQEVQSEIWWRANFDILTRLPNRNLFFDRLRQEISRTIRNNEILGLLFIDLDGFKAVNDTHGHEVGDLLLVTVAERIASCLRESDTVARLGGDEFTVTLTRQANPLDIERVADKIRLRVAEPIQIGDILVRVSASIGVAICPIDTDNFDELLSLADNAMYESKRLGKNCVRFSSAHIRDEAIERQVVLNELRKAIDSTELAYQLQPILRLSDTKVVKAEMLVRWKHPERGLISPSKFVEIAERTGAIIQLGDLVFEMGLEWLAANLAQLPQGFQLSINVSPIQFQVNPKKAEEWVVWMHQLGVPPSAVVIEITEGSLLVDDSSVRANLDYLKANGIRLALDDFGSGYSSMANLRTFSIDFIKIDQQFVQRMLHNESERSITEGIVSLAHRLGISVIAEGVELEGQAEQLKVMGCEYIQGYWVATPMWPDEFAEFMQEGPRTI